MKRVIVCGLFASGLFAMVSSAAGADGLEFYAKYQTSYGANETGHNFLIQARSGRTDGDDGPTSDVPMDLSWTPSPRTVAAIYKTSGVDGWDGPSGYYRADSRGAILPGTTKLFANIYFWAMPGTPAGDIRLYLPGIPAAIFDPGLTFNLYLVSLPGGITYNGPTHWTMAYGQTPHADIVLPYYATDEPSTGYKFRAEVTAIPEPSSLLALACGMAGAAGLRRLRRTR